MKGTILKLKRRIYLLIALFLIIGACRTLIPNNLTTENANNPQSNLPQNESNKPDDAPELDCERLGYACSYADANSDAVVRAEQLLDDASQLTADDNLTNAVDFLEQQNDVVEVIYNESVVLFWVENAIPMILFHSDIGPDYSNTAGAQLLHKRAAPHALPNPIDDGPIGEQDEGEQPTKRALLLSPMLWDFSGDEINSISNLLSNHRDYQCAGCIDTRIVAENPLDASVGQLQVGPGVNNFLSWQQYDLIHISTHGVQLCDVEKLGDGCFTLLYSGGYRNNATFDNGPDAEYSPYPGVYYARTAKTPENWRAEIISSDFFRSQYPSGLNDTLVIASACQTMISFDLADALLGENSTFLGWDESVNASNAANIFIQFYEYYVDDGLRAKVSYDKALAFDGYPADGGPSGADANLIFRGDDHTRGREVITIINPETQQATETDDILLSDGIAGDSENDELLIQFRVDGIDAEQDVSAFNIHLKINDEEIDNTLTATKQVSDYSYLTNLEIVELPYDVVNDNTKIDLEAWIELPTGGQTRHLVEQAEPVGCGWNATFDSTKHIGGIIFYSHDPGLQDQDALEIFSQYGGGLEGIDFSSISDQSPVYLMASEENNGLPSYIMSELGGTVLISQQEFYASEGPQLTVTPNGDALFGQFGGNFSGVSFSSGITNASVSGEFYWHPKSICGFETISWLIEAGFSEPIE